MLSVVIPTLNAEEGLARCLTSLVPAVVEGLVREVIVVDGGSGDRTLAIADQAGARIIGTQPGRGHQLQAGAREARSQWLLFLHSDTVLQAGWHEDVWKFTDKVDSGRRRESAAAFQFALDDDGFAPRILESAVALRVGAGGLPYGDQGLLISRKLYDEIGGFRSIVLMEDVEIAKRLGRRRLTMLRSVALTSAARYREVGYVRRIARNRVCMLMYLCGLPLNVIARYYGRNDMRERASGGVGQFGEDDNLSANVAAASGSLSDRHD